MSVNIAMFVKGLGGGRWGGGFKEDLVVRNEEITCSSLKFASG